MPYVKTITYAGDTIIVKKGFTQKQYGKRAEKQNETKRAMKIVNERNAVRKLTARMNANFKPGDFHLVLTYRKDERVNPTIAQQYLCKFLRNLRKVYHKANVELKYIYTTEYKSTAIHHHVLINQFDLVQIANVWKYGAVRSTVTYSQDYSKLAAYFVKETKKTFQQENSPSKQRYVASKNCTTPQQIVEIIESKHWRKEPKPLKGYTIVESSVESGISEVTGIPWQYYIMVPLQISKKEQLKNESNCCHQP